MSQDISIEGKSQEMISSEKAKDILKILKLRRHNLLLQVANEIQPESDPKRVSELIDLQTQIDGLNRVIEDLNKDLGPPRAAMGTYTRR